MSIQRRTLMHGTLGSGAVALVAGAEGQSDSTEVTIK